jgi:hypothetical protein
MCCCSVARSRFRAGGCMVRALLGRRILETPPALPRRL